MAEFKVEPGALDGFAKILGATDGPGLSTKYLIQYYDYGNEHLELGGSGLLFSWIKPKVEELKSKITSDSSSINMHLIESGFGLTSSATQYRNTDTVQARHVDSVYHPGGITPIDDGVILPGTTPDPASALVAPSDEGGVPDLVQEFLDAGGIFSISDLAIKILRWCGIDVMEWPRDKLAGDPRELAKLKNAVEALSDFNTDAASQIGSGSADMLSHWSGNAADAARSYFDQTANALSEYATELDAVSTRMQALIIAIQEGMAALEGAITTAIDKAIQCAVKVAAAGCLAEVPGIDIIVAIVGAESVYEVVNAIHKFFDIWNVVWAGHEGILGLITGLVGGFASYDISGKLPTTSYYNGSQGPAPDYSEPPARGGGAR